MIFVFLALVAFCVVMARKYRNPYKLTLAFLTKKVVFPEPFFPKTKVSL